MVRKRRFDQTPALDLARRLLPLPWCRHCGLEEGATQRGSAKLAFKEGTLVACANSAHAMPGIVAMITITREQSGKFEDRSRADHTAKLHIVATLERNSPTSIRKHASVVYPTPSSLVVRRPTIPLNPDAFITPLHGLAAMLTTS